MKQFVAVAFAAWLLVLNLLMIAQVRAERHLEQVAAQMRRNEISLYLQVSGTKTPLPPFVPPPR
jgi:heme exporter protein D